MIWSTYFKEEEFKCKCGYCKSIDIDPELVWILTCVRIKFGLPVIINSGYRCKKHNKRVGGEDHSYHMLGKAADIKIEGVDPIEIYNFVDDLCGKNVGMGLYERFVHIDTRGVKVRW